MFDTKTPSTLEILEDARLKRKVAELATRQQETAERLGEQHQTDEQIEAERFQFESNALAEKLPLYSAARAASTSLLVVPLEPGSTKPLVDLKEATNDQRQLFSWWQEWPDANPGVLLGRVGGIFALQVDDLAAYVRLRELTRVNHPGVEDGRDSVAPYVEYRELPRYTVRLVKPSHPVTMRLIQGWGPDYTRAIREVDQEERQRHSEKFFLVFSYHSVVSGLDAWDFRSRTVLPGVKLLGEGDVIPWQGSILDGGIQVVAPMDKPPEVPTWLASSIGRPRSRKAMAAAREAFEAIERRDTAHVTAALAVRRVYEEQERQQANKDREKAERVLAEVMAKD
jgi:hypothetical protein